jgi:hypothetical protein
MKRTALLVTMILGLILILTLSAAAQGDFSGRWTQVGVQGTYMIISSFSGNYTAVYVMGGQTTCQLNDVSISGNTITMKGRYASGEGFLTDLVFNLTLSDDRIMLQGTKWDDTHWYAKNGQPLHAADSRAVVFTR